jgi:hypothetical protein
MRTPKLPNAVNRDPVHYLAKSRWWLITACDGRFIRVPRHCARVHLMVKERLTHRDAEAKLNQIRDFTLANPEHAQWVCDQYRRDHRVKYDLVYDGHGNPQWEPIKEHDKGTN